MDKAKPAAKSAPAKAPAPGKAPAPSQGKWTVHQRELNRCMGLLVTSNNCRKPMAIGFQTDEIRREISFRPAPRELRSELIGTPLPAPAPAADKTAELEQ